MSEDWIDAEQAIALLENQDRRRRRETSSKPGRKLASILTILALEAV
jgi:hypothetical protein